MCLCQSSSGSANFVTPIVVRSEPSISSGYLLALADRTRHSENGQARREGQGVYRHPSVLSRVALSVNSAVSSVFRTLSVPVRGRSSTNLKAWGIL